MKYDPRHSLPSFPRVRGTRRQRTRGADDTLGSSQLHSCRAPSTGSRRLPRRPRRNHPPQSPLRRESPRALRERISRVMPQKRHTAYRQTKQLTKPPTNARISLMHRLPISTLHEAPISETHPEACCNTPAQPEPLPPPLPWRRAMGQRFSTWFLLRTRRSQPGVRRGLNLRSASPLGGRTSRASAQNMSYIVSLKTRQRPIWVKLH